MNLNPIDWYQTNRVPWPQSYQSLGFMGEIEWRKYPLNTPAPSVWILPFHQECLALKLPLFLKELQIHFALDTLPEAFPVDSSNFFLQLGEFSLIKFFLEESPRAQREIQTLHYLTQGRSKASIQLQNTLSWEAQVLAIVLQKEAQENAWEQLVKSPDSLTEYCLEISQTLATLHQSLKEFKKPIQLPPIPWPLCKRLGVINPPQLKGSFAHGDFHLGQVIGQSKAWKIIDWEGPPVSNPWWPELEQLPLGDLAGLMRSADYFIRLHQIENIDIFALWTQIMSRYQTHSKKFNSLDRQSLALALAARNAYEIDYETRARPAMLYLPQKGWETSKKWIKALYHG